MMLSKIMPDCSKELTVMLAYFSDKTIKGEAFSSSSSFFIFLQKQYFTEEVQLAAIQFFSELWASEDGFNHSTTKLILKV